MKAAYLLLIFTAVCLCGDESTIWTFLYGKTNNAYGAAGLMGNLFAESGLKSNILEAIYQKKLNMKSDVYTSRVDSGKYRNFANDRAGYGLAQWTSAGRKKALLDFAKTRKASIGDLNMQLEYLVKELKASYAKVWQTLTKAKTVQEASDVVVLKFEIPANAKSKLKQRAEYGKKYFEKFGKEEKKEEEPVKPADDKRKCPDFWNQYSKTNYPTREQYAEGMQKVIGATINYTQGGQRWYGISKSVCPPTPPKYADCSAFTTWGFWTAFGGLEDIVNGQKWTAGYTGSMQSKAKKVDFSECKPGDIILYPGHVATYIGNKQVLNYGSTGPAKVLKYNYKGITGCYRYDLPFGKPL